MRRVASVVLALLLLCLSACGGTTSAEPGETASDPAESPQTSPAGAPETQPPAGEKETQATSSEAPEDRTALFEGVDLEREPEDRTVTVEGLDIEGRPVAETASMNPDLGTSYLTPESLVPDSQLIVHGTVTRVTCSDVDGDAVTLYDVELEEVWLDDQAGGAGALIPGDRITVLQPGGYIPGDAFSAARGGRPGYTSEDLVLQTYFGTPLPVVEDEYVLFLTEASVFPGVYAVTGFYQGRFTVDGESVSRYRPEGTAPYADDAATLSELRARIEALPADFVPPALPGFDEVLNAYLAEIQQTADSEREAIRPYEGNASKPPYVGSAEKDIAFYGQIIEKLPDFYHGVLSRADEIAAGSDYHPSVLMLDQQTPDKVFGGNSFASVIIEKAGGVNAAGAYSSGQPTVAVSVEQILDMDPDIIFISSSFTRDYYTAEDLLADPAWQELSAVKAGRVYEVDAEDAWFDAEHNPGNPAVWMGVGYLQTVLYPEAYTEERFREDMDTYYSITDPMYEINKAFRTNG